MSHGGLNILPKKSWNVWNRDNREKVKKDQEAFAQEQDKKRKRQNEIEQEIRYAEMKERTKKLKQDQPPSYESLVSAQNNIEEKQEEEEEEKEDRGIRTAEGHFNFFADLEAISTAVQPNPEYEAEKKAKEEAELKKIGALTYLGQNSAELAEKKPWYYGLESSELTDAMKRKDDRRKEIEDPMREMKKHTGGTYQKKKEVILFHKEGEKKSKFDEMPTAPDEDTPKKPEKEKEKKPKKTIDELRKERLEREKKEREKSQKLLNHLSPSAKKDETRDGRRENNRGYNNSYASFSGAYGRASFV